MLILELRFFQQASQGAPSQERRPCWSSRHTATAQVKKMEKRKKSYKESVLLRKGRRSSRVTFLLLILAAKGKSFYYIYYYNKAYALQWQQMARVEREREREEKESEEKKTLLYIIFYYISISIRFFPYHSFPITLRLCTTEPKGSEREREKKKITTRTCGEFKDFLKTKMRLPRTFGGETGGVTDTALPLLLLYLFCTAAIPPKKSF